MDNYVGPYRILRLIDRGGQGSVYLGYDKRLHRRVAIKIYDLPDTRAARRKLRREARLVASIQSPKVVQIHDVIESSSHLGLIMEYVPGCSLEEYLAEVRPSLASVLRVGTDVAGALAMARQQHIVHGDVKAGNVLIAESGRVKLTDFGIARAASTGMPRQRKAGSRSAVSPEQLRGEPLDPRADLFALGCLLYRMLSGEHPFYRQGRLDTDMLLNRDPAPLQNIVNSEEEVPESLLQLINDLLQKNPRDRPPDTRRVRQVLRLVFRSLPVSSRDNLLEESRPYFRQELPEDMPPLIPRELGQQGRSALSPGGTRAARMWHILKSLKWPAQVATAGLVLAVFSIPIVLARQQAVTPVRFSEPVAKIDQGVLLPRGVSNAWLLEQVKLALREQLGTMRVVSEVGADPVTSLYSRGRPKEFWLQPEQTFDIALRCVKGICVFSIRRDVAGTRYNRRDLLLADVPIEQWRDIVRETTLSLFP